MGIAISQLNELNTDMLQAGFAQANSSLMETASIAQTGDNIPESRSVYAHVLTRRLTIPLTNLGAQPQNSASFPIVQIPLSIIQQIATTVETQNPSVQTGDILSLSGTLHLNMSYSDFEAWRAANINFYLQKDSYGGVTGKFRSNLSDGFGSQLYQMPYGNLSFYTAPDLAIYGATLPNVLGEDLTLTIFGNILYDTYSVIDIPRLLVHGHIDIEATIAQSTLA